MSKKKVEYAGDEQYEEIWDKKKIAIAGIILLFLLAAGFGVKQYLLPKAEQVFPTLKSAQVQGISTQDTSSSGRNNSSHFTLPSADNVQQQVQAIQQEVTHLNVADIASSSPQVQQVIQQLQQLPQQPVNQAKDACIRLCSQL